MFSIFFWLFATVSWANGGFSGDDINIVPGAPNTPGFRSATPVFDLDQFQNNLTECDERKKKVEKIAEIKNVRLKKKRKAEFEKEHAFLKKIQKRDAEIQAIIEKLAFSYGEQLRLFQDHLDALIDHACSARPDQYLNYNPRMSRRCVDLRANLAERMIVHLEDWTKIAAKDVQKQLKKAGLKLEISGDDHLTAGVTLYHAASSPTVNAEWRFKDKDSGREILILIPTVMSEANLVTAKFGVKPNASATEVAFYNVFTDWFAMNKSYLGSSQPLVTSVPAVMHRAGELSRKDYVAAREREFVAKVRKDAIAAAFLDASAIQACINSQGQLAGVQRVPAQAVAVADDLGARTTPAIIDSYIHKRLADDDGAEAVF